MTARSPLLVLVALAAARLLHPGPTPRAQDAAWTPAAGALRAASLGHPTLAATALWMRTVARWSAEHPPSSTQAGAIHAEVRTIGTLDPSWESPWWYGSLMLCALGRLERHDDLRREASSRFPDHGWPRCTP